MVKSIYGTFRNIIYCALFSIYIQNNEFMSSNIVTNPYQKNLDQISLYLCELRFAKNKTQMEASKEMGLHRNSLLRIENSKNFTIKTLLLLADYYSLQPSEILSIID